MSVVLYILSLHQKQKCTCSTLIIKTHWKQKVDVNLTSASFKQKYNEQQEKYIRRKMIKVEHYYGINGLEHDSSVRSVGREGLK